MMFFRCVFIVVQIFKVQRNAIRVEGSRRHPHLTAATGTYLQVVYPFIYSALDHSIIQAIPLT